MPIVNPGLRRFIGTLSRLLNSAVFFAPLTRSLVPTRGTGSPTFTRATTATFTDYEGVLRTAPAGCAAFTGARFVRNLLTYTEDFSNAAWVASNVTKSNGVSDPLGTNRAGTITATANNGLVYQAVTPPAATGYVALNSIYIKRRTGTGSVYFRTANNVDVDVTSSVTTSWTRISSAPATPDAGTWYFVIKLATSGDAVDIAFPQLQDITGRADQTTPSEYVSVGVLSAPYHGAGIDGCKFFDTDLDGNPLTTLDGISIEGARTNLCLQSNAFTTTWTANGTPVATQNTIGPDGATSAWTLTDNDAGTNEGILQSITLTAATYTYSIFVKKTTGAQASYPMIYANNGSTTIALCTIDTSNGIATVWTAYTGLTIATSSAVCVSYNASYWRVSLTFLGTAAAWNHLFIPAGTTNATQSTGVIDATAQGSAVIYGAQLELGSFASSYIPTTTVAVQRNADVKSDQTASNIAAAASSVYLEFTPTHTPSGTIALWGTYVDASNYTAILHDATNLIMRKRIAGVNTDATIANAFVAGTTYKVCGTWGAAGQNIYLNGTKGTAHANTTAAQIGTTMQFCADGNSLQQPFAAGRNERVWQRQLSDAEGQAVTK